MNLPAVQQELVRRLLTVVGTAYATPSASPVFPCAIVTFPIVTAFRVDYLNDVTRLGLQIEMHAGRGDTDDAFAQLSRWLSAGAENVIAALTAKDPDHPAPWLRLTPLNTDAAITTTESVSVPINFEIDCA